MTDDPSIGARFEARADVGVDVVEEAMHTTLRAWRVPWPGGGGGTDGSSIEALNLGRMKGLMQKCFVAWHLEKPMRIHTHVGLNRGEGGGERNSGDIVRD